MRYYGMISGLAPAPAPALLPTGGEEEEKKRPDLRRLAEKKRPDLWMLALLCVGGAVLVAGMIYIITKKKKGRS